MDTVDAADMRNMNNNALLKMIWQGQEISRADISRMTGMSRSTVSAIVSDLMHRDLVTEQGTGSSKGGRRPVILTLNADAYSILGIDIGATHISVALTNLRGMVRESRYCLCPVQTHPEQTIEILLDAISGMKKRTDAEKSPLIGIGVGLPCPVNPDEDVSPLHPLVLPAWKEYNLRDILRERFDLPLVFENDANLGALAELRWGKEPRARNLAFIKLSTGVGAGIIIDGRIYRGARGLAGELGHTVLTMGNHRFRQHARMLNDSVGMPRLLRRAAELNRSVPQPWADGNGQQFSIQRWVDAMASGDSHAEDLFEDAAYDLSVSITNLLVTLDLETIVIGGSLYPAAERLVEKLTANIRENTIWPELQSIDLRWSQLGEHQIAIGAATLILETAMDDLTWFPSKGIIPARSEAHYPL